MVHEISVVMPYWKREKELRRTLESYEEHYGEWLEVVVVVDGCEVPALREYPFPVKLVELPWKEGPANPCVPINRGVEASSHSIIGLTNPESEHPMPVLQQMTGVVDENHNAYCVAACWNVELNGWLQHSEHDPRNFHWMSVLQRSLFDAVGGFDEDYRDGQGYDDDDFVKRLLAHGAEFVLRDDLVVNHHKHTSIWSGIKLNKRLYERKWGLSS